MFLELKSRVPVMAASCVLVTSEQLFVPGILLNIASITAAVRSQIFALTCAIGFTTEIPATGMSERNPS